jgi:hypothetical protein
MAAKSVGLLKEEVKETIAEVDCRSAPSLADYQRASPICQEFATRLPHLCANAHFPFRPYFSQRSANSLFRGA